MQAADAEPKAWSDPDFLRDYEKQGDLTPVILT
jgi:hypothetical protein